MKCPRCGEDVFVEGHPDSDPTINQSCDCELTQSEVDELIVQHSEYTYEQVLARSGDVAALDRGRMQEARELKR